MDDLLPFDAIKQFSFQRRPISIPAQLRPLFRIAQIILIIKINGRAAKASSLQLHLLCWALNSQENMEELLECISSTHEVTSMPIRLDPAINRALQLAIADEFLRFENTGKFTIATKGEEFYANISMDNQVLPSEKAFLRVVGKKLSDAAARRMIEGKRK